jgi:hypothetical protein
VAQRKAGMVDFRAAGSENRFELVGTTPLMMAKGQMIGQMIG